MKKSTSAPNLPLLKTQHSVITRRNSHVCHGFDMFLHDVQLSQEAQSILRAPLHHVATCLASQEKFPDDILHMSEDLAVCIATPYDEVDVKMPELPPPKHKNHDNPNRIGELLVRIRRQRSQKPK